MVRKKYIQPILKELLITALTYLIYEFKANKILNNSKMQADLKGYNLHFLSLFLFYDLIILNGATYTTSVRVR